MRRPAALVNADRSLRSDAITLVGQGGCKSVTAPQPRSDSAGHGESCLPVTTIGSSGVRPAAGERRGQTTATRVDGDLLRSWPEVS